MKRLIKVYNQYISDENNYNFSTCSTKYEVFPKVVSDSADRTDLRRLGVELGIDLVGNVKTVIKPEYGFRSLKITHAIKTAETIKRDSWGRQESDMRVYLAFITIPEGSLDIKETLDNPVTEAEAYRIVDSCEYGVSDCGQMTDESIVMVLEGWDYFHAMSMAGYSLKSFEDVLGVTEQGFSDDTFRCGSCGVFDHRDDGYTYNHRDVGGEFLGVNCGCYEEAAKANWESYIDDPKQCVELSVAEALEAEGLIEHVERFIGGMTDGRGGYYNGESTREGDPESILVELKEKNPDSQYLFTHDESGQFQTYFSVWRVVVEGESETDKESERSETGPDSKELKLERIRTTLEGIDKLMTTLRETRESNK